jgi:hypothetical protein
VTNEVPVEVVKLRKRGPKPGFKMNVEHRRKIGLALKGHVISNETREKIRIDHTGKIHSEECKQKISAALLGRFKSPIHRQRIGKSKIGKPRSAETKRKLRLANLGKHPSAETKKKLRLSTIAYIEQHGGVRPCMGSNEQELLDRQEHIDGVRIIRQYPIKALGYIVDGYCPETNMVYEVYEKYHDSQVQKDLGRETEICNFLSCDFMILWDR